MNHLLNPRFWAIIFLVVAVGVGVAQDVVQPPAAPAEQQEGQPTAAEETQTPAVRFQIAVMGDIPYTPEEETTLREQIADLNTIEGLPFVMHVGDIKAGATPCDESIYVNVAEMLRASTHPLFIIPGDNEWNDCMDPDTAWDLWVKHYTKFDEKWEHKLPVERQMGRDVNFAFVHERVLFLAVQLMGGRVQDADEWKERHADCLRWTAEQLAAHKDDVTHAVVFTHANPTPTHDDFMEGFIHQAAEFAKPVLFLHGDGHVWIEDKPYEMAQNIQRIQVDQGGIAPPLLVKFTDDAERPFIFDRQIPEEVLQQRNRGRGRRGLFRGFGGRRGARRGQ